MCACSQCERYIFVDDYAASLYRFKIPRSRKPPLGLEGDMCIMLPSGEEGERPKAGRCCWESNMRIWSKISKDTAILASTTFSVLPAKQDISGDEVDEVVVVLILEDEASDGRCTSPTLTLVVGGVAVGMLM